MARSAILLEPHIVYVQSGPQEIDYNSCVTLAVDGDGFINVFRNGLIMLSVQNLHKIVIVVWWMHCHVIGIGNFAPNIGLSCTVRNSLPAHLQGGDFAFIWLNVDWIATRALLPPMNTHLDNKVLSFGHAS